MLGLEPTYGHPAAFGLALDECVACCMEAGAVHADRLGAEGGGQRAPSESEADVDARQALIEVRQQVEHGGRRSKEALEFVAHRDHQPRGHVGGESVVGRLQGGGKLLLKGAAVGQRAGGPQVTDDGEVARFAYFD